MEESSGLHNQEKLTPLYLHSEDVHNMIAPREVAPLIIGLLKPKSILDVGCGTGTWLKAFNELGVSDYIGVDGDYVQDQLQISTEHFVAKDLRTQWYLNRKFALVLSLEVAEHLPEKCADVFVETLVRHAEGAIIFSAAIPGQGGQNHLNEQWPEYWEEKFLKHGFYFHDVIRPEIWNNEKVDWWYRQNIFLLTKEPSHATILHRVHPDCFKQVSGAGLAYRESVLQGKQGLRVSVSVLYNAVKFKLKKVLRIE